MARIVHFGKYYFPDTGGIESVTASLARGTASAGHSVSVVCFRKTPGKTKEVIDGVQVTRAPLAMTVASQPLGFKYFFLVLESRKTSRYRSFAHAEHAGGIVCFIYWRQNTITGSLAQ